MPWMVFWPSSLIWGLNLVRIWTRLPTRALLVSIYVVLGIIEHLPGWIVIIVVSRDVAIVGAVILSWLMNRPIKIEPNMVSKANTVMQILLVVGLLAALGFSSLNPVMVGRRIGDYRSAYVGISCGLFAGLVTTYGKGRFCRRICRSC